MRMQTDPNIERVEAALALLGSTSDQMVFLGGCATGLLITEPGASSPRVTQDLDAIVELTSLVGYHRLAEQLRALGFSEDLSPEAPICRWKANEIILDIMPTDPDILGFGNKWFAPAFASARLISLPSGRTVRVLPAPYFLATKLAAFQGRGHGDFLLSKDIEDIITIIDGRPEIAAEVQKADSELRLYLQQVFRSFLSNRDFIDALPGHLPPDAASQARIPVLLGRIRSMCDFKLIR